MKKVLIIPTYFTDNALIGSIRPSGLARYLPEYGWEPIILSPQIPNQPALPPDIVKVIEYRDIHGEIKQKLGAKVGGSTSVEVARKGSLKRIPIDILLKIFGAVAIPDYSILWWPFAVRTVMEKVKKENLKIDAIITTVFPLGPLFIAYSLKPKLNVPWIADFRDLWTLNHYYAYGELRRALEKRLEWKILSRADVITTISQQYIDQLYGIEFYKNKDLRIIPLGFDPAVYSSSTKLTNKFTITFTVTFIRGKREPFLLFRALKELLEEKTINPADLEIRFFGRTEDWTTDWIDEAVHVYGLEKVFKYYGYVSHAESIQRQKESQILVMFLWDHPSEEGAYSGKIEYFGARRPIIALGGPSKGVLKDLLGESRGGVYAREVGPVKAFLKEAYREYKENGFVAYKGREEVVNKHSYRTIAGEFAKILDELTSNRK
jgi:glycosyltransferase involved in cell wall biosynthesis